ncbi:MULTISPECIES: hypothetical protein [unclassified Rhodococcus (in: high G+C Gram-positive bacteria)]|uniref:hypothetical protein n=1 Tax=unclassified Rhodococcus (in: high G+C Gram-positive bacteria) TaxID=192944 RepID=UPI0029543526|nr:hypothetical protein [Rhodococcus sp. IEGM 1343]MDV8054078.1 hypothetical protein [Rhodococcus sp. IEGM 1343]
MAHTHEVDYDDTTEDDALPYLLTNDNGECLQLSFTGRENAGGQKETIMQLTAYGNGPKREFDLDLAKARELVATLSNMTDVLSVIQFDGWEALSASEQAQ